MHTEARVPLRTADEGVRGTGIARTGIASAARPRRAAYAACAAFLGSALALGLAGGCAVNPATGGADIVFSSLSGEIEIGREMHAEMQAKGTFYDDPELQAYVDRVGQHLVRNSDMPDLEFTFTVIDAPDLNAFATPGGFVYINRGLLAYLNSEAEMAGVLAHEIGHVTARHHARRKTASVGSKVAATTAYVFTGSSAVYEAAGMYSAELISGYGREMELEADGVGARYLYNSGYDPQALLDVIGALKNQEQFQRVKSRATGKPVATYHGLYATHPRNDKRLQTVVSAAAELGEADYADDPEEPGEFRRMTDGVVWGQSAQGQREANRYYHNKLGFTFAHPEGWQVDAGAQAVVASAADGSRRMTLRLQRRTADSDPQSVLTSTASGTLSDGRALEQAGLEGYTAVASSGGTSRRLAVIEMGSLLYLFEGEAADFGNADGELLALIESFRPMKPEEQQRGDPQFVRYVQVPRGATLASIAAQLNIPDAEAQLRLMNGYYPRGEPRVGDWIKIVAAAPPAQP